MTRPGQALYVARRAPSTAQIWLTEPEVTRLTRDLRPYLQLTRTDQMSQECWTIWPNHPQSGGGIPITQPGVGRHDVAYHLWLDPATRTIFLAPEPSEAMLTQCRRLLRAVLQRELRARSGVCMQAAFAVSHDSDAGIAIIGGSRTGKTSLLLAMLLSGRFDYCANDDVAVIDDAQEGPRGLGWPRAISIRRDTLRRFAPAGSRLHAALGEARHPNSGATWGSGRLDHRAWLFPDELADATGVAVQADAVIRVLVFPRFDSAASRPRLTPIRDPDVAARRLQPYIEATSSRHESWLDPYFPAPAHADSHQRLRALCSQTVAFELAHRMASLPQSAALLDAVSTDGRTS